MAPCSLVCTWLEGAASALGRDACLVFWELATVFSAAITIIVGVAFGLMCDGRGD
jgi:hypothetical protein